MVKTWQLGAGLESWGIMGDQQTPQKVSATPIYSKNVIGREQRRRDLATD